MDPTKICKTAVLESATTAEGARDDRIGRQVASSSTHLTGPRLFRSLFSRNSHPQRFANRGELDEQFLDRVGKDQFQCCLFPRLSASPNSPSRPATNSKQMMKCHLLPAPEHGPLGRQRKSRDNRHRRSWPSQPLLPPPQAFPDFVESTHEMQQFGERRSQQLL